MVRAALSPLRDPTYRRLFGAQVIALLGTGLLTVALALLAFEVAPTGAGAVVGTALTLKIVAYVALAPVVTAVTSRWHPRTVLVGADVVRILVAAALPWVTEVWQVYVLVVVLQAASATFTPTFQALIPAVLPDEDEYTRALSLSRLAYDLEAVVSPILAAAMLLVLDHHGLFAGTALGFVGSALLVACSGLRAGGTRVSGSWFDRATAGLRMFAARRRLRALLLLDAAAACATAVVLVNTVVVVRDTLGLGAPALALTFGAFGAGSMAVALIVPRQLRRRSDLPLMTLGGAGCATGLVAAVWVATGAAGWPAVIVVWTVLGVATSLVLTPGGRVVNAAVAAEERPAAYAAHFSLSHACYLVTYPVAGWFGDLTSVPLSTAVLAGAACLATVAAAGVAGRCDVRGSA